MKANPACALYQAETVSVEWDSLGLDVWQGYFNRISKSNLMQTYGYARALRFVRKQVTRFGLICVGGTPKGLVQIQEVGLFGLVHFVFLDRGPLWFEPVTPQEIESFFAEFNRFFPKRFGRKRRVMPELPLSDENHAMIERAGFSLTGRGYRSAWLEIDEQSFSRFDSSVRNKIRKAEKAGLIVQEGLQNLEEFLRGYAEDRAQKKYFGPSVPLLQLLCREFGGDTLLLCARDGSEIVAGILIFIHGQSATYQVGWSNARGREKAAHNFLILRSAEELKKRGAVSLDLGGINDETAGGVSAFKRALGGQEFELVGIYR